MKNQKKNGFINRHIGPNPKQLTQQLNHIRVPSLETLIDQTIPKSIQLNKDLNLPKEMNEKSILTHLKAISQKNKPFTTHIGLGFYNTIMPSVIQRTIFENPGWYTQYTPYQSEISQGRLEALFNFQTMITELTKMEVANASLLDESSAAAEAMQLLYRVRSPKKKDSHRYLVCQSTSAHTIDVLHTRATPLNITIKETRSIIDKLSNDVFGLTLQYPNQNGSIEDLTKIIEKSHQLDIKVCIITDLMALTLIKAPGEFNADVVVGNSQRFGVPLGYGGPHAAFIATRKEFQRQLPGRIIGLSIDKDKNPAYRMALQTREQHIRKEKATSNICTAQTFSAILASMYAVYHGPNGLRSIATKIHTLTTQLNKSIQYLKLKQLKQLNEYYFDTLCIQTTPKQLEAIKTISNEMKINFRYSNNSTVTIACDETTEEHDINNILIILSKACNSSEYKLSKNEGGNIPKQLERSSPYLTQAVFNTYHSETKLLRYINQLEKKDLSLVQSMIPLGSCTMKLTGTTLMMPLSWPEFSTIHPFVPNEQAKGYEQIINELESYLCEITGFSAASLQPNSGAQGEYAGLLTIKNYFQDTHQSNRNTLLVPLSAHGTNPASASMAGFKIVTIKCDENGNIHINHLKEKVTEHAKNLAGLMITYPSTHGVYEEDIQIVCQLIHTHGGLVYMDGANMNAQVGLTNPAKIGADICHLNLHKTFSIPHGGGGPGMGPICTTAQLAPYLPSHRYMTNKTTKGGAIGTTPWGSTSILLISYAYIRLLGNTGLKKVTQVAILNANYIKSRLEPYYTVLYQGKHNRVAHELIIDFRPFRKTLKIEVEDIAKRLMDFGFHAPTMSWPVAGTLMIEPTESEDQEELDRFCDALICIKKEINDIQNGSADPRNNVLKNAPHTIQHVTANEWLHPYSREKAAYPIDYLKTNKFWPSVSRVDNAYGDRNIMCSCAPVEHYSSSRA